MRNLLFAVVSLFFFSGYAQVADVNTYQYVIVPRKFEFQRYENQYRLNTLVKFLLEKEGFEAYFEGDLPEVLVKDPCKALKAVVDDRSNLFTTRVVFSLADCYGRMVFESEEGKSRIKEYEPSFHEAFRNAFSSFQALQYTYAPTEGVSAEEETQNVVAVAPTPEAPSAPPAPEVEEAAAVVAVSAAKPAEPVGLLYAQAIENGYQLVDTTPTLRFKVKKTSRENTFTIEGVDGLLYRNAEGNWVAEYYKDGVLVTEVYEIKF